MGGLLHILAAITCVAACSSFVVTRSRGDSTSLLYSDRKKYDCELPDGFEGPTHNRRVSKPNEPIVVGNLDELKDLIKQGG